MERAQGGDREAAREAVRVLRAGTGDTQPEVRADLEMNPPDLVSAGQRLRALSRSLDASPGITDPGRAAQELRTILAQPRYAGLQPSVWDRIQAWVLEVVDRALRALARAPVPPLAAFAFLAAGVGLAALIVVLIVRGAWRGRGRERARPAGQAARAAADDHFAEADRLAAQGDYVGAVRSLAHAVATELSGQPFWDSSPLTVRELFRRFDPPDQLRPLLLAFEAGVYGHRLPDSAIYAGAAAAAAHFRRQR